MHEHLGGPCTAMHEHMARPCIVRHEALRGPPPCHARAHEALGGAIAHRATYTHGVGRGAWGMARMGNAWGTHGAWRMGHGAWGGFWSLF